MSVSNCDKKSFQQAARGPLPIYNFYVMYYRVYRMGRIIAYRGNDVLQLDRIARHRGYIGSELNVPQDVLDKSRIRAFRQAVEYTAKLVRDVAEGRCLCWVQTSRGDRHFNFDCKEIFIPLLNCNGDEDWDPESIITPEPYCGNPIDPDAEAKVAVSDGVDKDVVKILRHAQIYVPEATIGNVDQLVLDVSGYAIKLELNGQSIGTVREDEDDRQLKHHKFSRIIELKV